MAISGGQDVNYARLAYYDRAALAAMLSSYFSGSPHGQTTRFSYTVPSARRALVPYCQVGWRRSAAAATPNTVQESIEFTPAGGSSQYLILQYLLGDNTIPTTVTYLSIAPHLWLAAGDAILCKDVDSSIGGGIEQVESMTYLEFGV